MKLTRPINSSLLIGAIFLTSCATIVGGSRYNAHIVVDNPNAKIAYKGEVKGIGTATFQVKRKEANKLVFTVQENGCNEQKFSFASRTFRGFAFVGTVVTWTGLTINGGPFIPIPFGVIVDGLTGAWWKPNIREKGVSKMNYKNFRYKVNYTGCSQNSSENKQ